MNMGILKAIGGSHSLPRAGRKQVEPDLRGRLAGRTHSIGEKIGSTSNNEGVGCSNGWWGKRSLLCVPLIAFVFLGGLQSALSQEQPVPNFVAHGLVRSEQRNGNGTLGAAYESTFRFSFSNGWWQVELAFLYPTNFVGGGYNCRNVFDGIRFFQRPSAKDLITAGPSMEKEVQMVFAYPISYPPPEFFGMLPCWLSLCPRPQLPSLGGSAIRRFLASKASANPENIGEGQFRFLNEGQGFLSELILRNNGFAYDLITDAFVKYRKPLDQGFDEFSYRLADCHSGDQRDWRRLSA